MSEERETELYNHLQGLSKDEIIGITIREFNENRYFREVKIGECLKENQQLKENEKKLYTSNGNVFTKYELLDEYEKYKSVLNEIREYINNYDVFKEFSFPLMKRDEENQVKSSIDYEFQTSIKKSLLQILDKVKENDNKK